MSVGAASADTAAPGRMPFAELVAFAAAVMALNALAIDMMLPALGVIARDLGAQQANDRQLVVVVYVVVNGVAQLVFGPIADRIGRRSLLLFALGGYCLASLLSVFAESFGALLAARAFQGATTAASRVAMTAMVRDHFSGRRMAEVMSLALTIFMAAPILAPGLGQLVLMAAPWRGVFACLLLYGAALFAWALVRAPETLAVGDRRPIAAASIAAAYGEVMTHRVFAGYTLASAACFGALFGYISASEQIFLETFKLGARFPLAFAAVAAALAAANFANARMVGRIGMRRMMHAALVAFVTLNALHAALGYAGYESFALFIAFMMASFFCLGLIGPNASAIAMEPMGHIAGAAAAANGFAGTTVAGVAGGLIGRAYDGTTAPVVAGFAASGAVALAIVLYTEKGRLMRPARPGGEA